MANLKKHRERIFIISPDKIHNSLIQQVVKGWALSRTGLSLKDCCLIEYLSHGFHLCGYDKACGTVCCSRFLMTLVETCSCEAYSEDNSQAPKVTPHFDCFGVGIRPALTLVQYTVLMKSAEKANMIRTSK